ncbi:MAG: hypothetical protein QXF01_02395 [Candidatus Micrarchaeaceae archaeon]
MVAGTEGFLTGRMSMNAKLVTSIGSIKRKLSHYPSLSLIAEGSSLRYMLNHDSESRFYILSITREDVALELFSRTPPIYFINEALLRLLSFAAVLSEDLEFDMRSIFPYLIEALSSQIPQPKIAKLDSGKAKPQADLILAGRINQLLRQKAQLERELSESAAKLSRIVALHIIKCCGPAFEAESILGELGIGIEELGVAIAIMPELGCRAVHMGRGRYSLVKYL